jgi:hypothetical protein
MKSTKPHGGKRRLVLPTLKECRSAFDAHIGQTHEWEEDEPESGWG